MKIQIKPYTPVNVLNKLLESKNFQTIVPVVEKSLPESSAARFTLERAAEELSPQEYIQARSYLSNIEMDNMYKQLDEMLL